MLEFCVAGSIEDYLKNIKKDIQGNVSNFYHWRRKNLINWLDPISRLKRKIPYNCDAHDFQRWCYETAVGMEYIAGQNVRKPPIF